MTEVLDFPAFCDSLSIELDLALDPALADARLVEDLAFDSLLLYELVITVEDWAGAQFPEQLIPQLVTLRDVYDVYTIRAGQSPRSRSRLSRNDT